MSAESDTIRQTLVDQLSSFESRLDSKIDDVKMLADIQEAIGRVLGENGSNEAEIRRVLQDRFESGDLRKETFQLVKSMLDRYVTERIPTSPGFGNEIAANSSDALLPPKRPDDETKHEDPLSSTAVIPAITAAAADSADERVQVGSVLRDRFMLQERVAAGAMGVVYKALDRRLAEAGSKESSVAIKILSPQLAENGQALRALQQEAAKGRCLTHPNIVRFIDLDREEDLYFMVMEWLEGRTLADILDSPDSRSVDQARAFEIIRQIGEALDYAHRCGIVHADVKPGNIMIMPNGDAKLFDFGVARVRQKQIEEQPDFDPGVLGLLTPAYSSMQVLTGEDPTAADDVFSLACLLYRLIAGYRVFGPRNAAEAAAEGMKPQRLQGISDAQWRVLKKALSYARVTRFDSMAEFVDALDVHAQVNETMTITAPPREDMDLDESPGAGRYVIGLVVLLALLGGAAWQFGLLDELKHRFGIEAGNSTVSEPVATSVDQTVDSALVETVAEPADDSFNDQAAIFEPPDPVAEPETGTDRAGGETVPDDVVPEAFQGAPPAVTADVSDEAVTIDPQIEKAIERPIEEKPVVAPPPLVDFSLLPRPTAQIELAEDGSRARSANVRLREDGRPVVIDLVRHNVAVPLRLRIEEVRHSGNRSPWASGQFALSNDGIVEFPVGQTHGRVTMTMASDPLREADQQITLRIREADRASSELAIITATLEDDDQRAFESTLPANTVAFATSQVSVREQDPAVQIDVLRFNPDNTSLVVGFQVRDITATQGEDYFAPGSYSVEFGPGQRTARILIPLVQDSEYEDNEAFSIELSTADSVADSDIYLRTAIMIRDDDL